MTQPPASRQRIISWAEMHRDAQALGRRLATAGPWHGIIAVARGGLVPTAIIARELDLRFVDTICIASYDERIRGRATILKELHEAEEGAGWLVIDDLVDTGITARRVREMMPRAHIAALYAKPAGRPALDSYLLDVEQDVWLVFPWEMAPA